ncbi:MAG: hypothetical protein K6F44_05985 [Lachnospiraceae bacterium]|nr:hypothetical protein [Lachnospiraceae bacterium]
MFKDTVKELLIDNDHKRILLYGLEGLGKTYFACNLFKEIRGGFIIVNFKSDDTTGIINELKKGKDITEALVTAYGLSEVLQNVTFVLDEFTELDHIDGISDLITEKKDSYRYKEIKILFITSDVSWVTRHKDRFDECVKAGKVTFAQFLRKSGDSFYAGVVEAHMTKKKSMPSLIHNELIDMYYNYISTGGYIRAVSELTRDDQAVFAEDLAAERYKTLIGNICSETKNTTSSFNKVQIINAIPECSKNSKFIISKTGRRHLSKEQLESDINDLVNEGILIKINRLGSDTYSLALTDDAIYWYLLRKNRIKLNLSEEKIKDLVIENHLRNILYEYGFKTITWAGKYRFKINILVESAGKYYPVRVSCNKSYRNLNYDEFLSKYGKMTSTHINFTENSFSESGDSIYLPIYGCEYINSFIPQV